MPRRNNWTGVMIINAAALVLMASLAGCTQSDSRSNSSTPAALNEASVTADGLPEVVVTARRLGRETVALSEGGSEAAAGTSPIQAHHR
jgi:hypothetical protein